MGLDMFLGKMKKVEGYTFEELIEAEKQDPETLPEEIKQYSVDWEDNISSLLEPIGQWRKANQIHNFFVEYVQHGEDNQKAYTVGDGDLKLLRREIKKVLANPEAAPEILPTKEGFFFGSTDYDENYFDILRTTLDIIDEALKVDLDEYYLVYTSWY